MRAAWHHHAARDAVEVVDLEPLPRGWRLRGTVTGVEAGTTFALQYVVRRGYRAVPRTAVPGVRRGR